MTCEACKTECCHLPRRICHACHCGISLHDKWFFDETAGGKPRHSHCDNPQSYLIRESVIGTVRISHYAGFNTEWREHQRAMEELVGSH